jgi:hypothetical protein
MSRNRFGLTGNHITILGVTSILAVMSGAVWSVDAYTNVAVQDPTNGRKAAIDVQRQLLVKDTRGAADLLHGTYVRFWKPALTACTAIATPPAGKSLVIKSLMSNTYINPTPGSGHFIYFYVGTGCVASSVVGSINPGGIGIDSLSFEPGLVVPSGQSLFFYKSSTIQSEVFGTGYSIPSVWGPPSVPVMSSAVASETQTSKHALGNGG